MTKKQRLKELSNLIKETYYLDVVTTSHTKSQQHKLDMKYNPDVVIFKMRYRLTGGDVVQMCPISWVAIDGIDWEGDDPDDPESHEIHQDGMVQLIIKTCGEVLANHTAVKRTLSTMAKNAEIRANQNYIITQTKNNSVIFDGLAKMEEAQVITGDDVKKRIDEIEASEPKPKKK